MDLDIVMMRIRREKVFQVVRGNRASGTAAAWERHHNNNIIYRILIITEVYTVGGFFSFFGCLKGVALVEHSYTSQRPHIIQFPNDVPIYNMTTTVFRYDII